ncbi:acyl-CoA desaturase [Leptospira sp. 96542]|nr:acyl-CoA desaturase [Leptospira sp. 96542]
MNSTQSTVSPVVKQQAPFLFFVLFLLIQATVLTVLTVPFTWELFWLAVGSYFLRMFGITGAYHRYFSHASFKTSRVFQFVLAWIGSMAMQKGVLWWAAHHRNHHKYSDTDKDIHSPSKKGFWYSHMLWFLKDEYNDYEAKLIPDFYKYPELRLLDKYHWVAPLSYAVILYAIGGWAWLVYGYALATFILGHATWTINSLSHVYGSVRFDSRDTSKNNFWLAILTMGEGWHNNHHHYCSSVNQGFYWYEVDVTYYILKFLSFFGIVWDLKKPPQKVLEEGRRRDEEKRLARSQPKIRTKTKMEVASVTSR